MTIFRKLIFYSNSKYFLETVGEYWCAPIFLCYRLTTPIYSFQFHIYLFQFIFYFWIFIANIIIIIAIVIITIIAIYKKLQNAGKEFVPAKPVDM